MKIVRTDKRRTMLEIAGKLKYLAIQLAGLKGCMPMAKLIATASSVIEAECNNRAEGKSDASNEIMLSLADDVIIRNSKPKKFKRPRTSRGKR